MKVQQQQHAAYIRDNNAYWTSPTGDVLHVRGTRIGRVGPYLEGVKHYLPWIPFKEVAEEQHFIYEGSAYRRLGEVDDALHLSQDRILYFNELPFHDSLGVHNPSVQLIPRKFVCDPDLEETENDARRTA